MVMYDKRQEKNKEYMFEPKGKTGPQHVQFVWWDGQQLQFCQCTPILDQKTAQRAKKVVSDSPALVDFAIGLANSVHNLPNGQVK